jgi:hypothetical protein
MDHYSEFIDSYNSGDYAAAHGAILSELGKISVTNREDFLHLLNESGVPADDKMSNEELIGLFLDNLSENRELMLGASLLANMSNRKTYGIDGPEPVNDSAVKAGYEVLSNAGGGIVSSVADVLSSGAKLTDRIIANKNKKNNGVMDALIRKKDNEAAMKLASIKADNARIQAKAKKDEADAKKKKTTIIVVGSILGLALIVGTVIYIKNKK